MIMEPSVCEAQTIRMMSSTTVLRGEVMRLLARDVFTGEYPTGGPKPRGSGILLTGATGCLGTALLGHLLQDSRELTVYCLVRADSESAGFERLRGALMKSGRWEERFAARIRAVPGDLSKPRIGLDEARIRELRGSIADIIHSGAHLNFIASYRALRAENVESVLALVEEFCAPAGVHLHHVSSVGVMTGEGFPDELSETRSYLDDTVELIGGYSQSKWVADQALYQLQLRGWPISLLRPAHVIEAPGCYPEATPLVEFFFALMRSRLVPELDFQFYFTPLEAFASATVALLSAPDEVRCACHHFVSEPIPCQEVVRHLESGSPGFERHPLGIWKDLIRKACLENSWDFAPMILYVYYMTESRLRLGRVVSGNAARLGWGAPEGERWDAACFAGYIRSVFPEPLVAAAAVPDSGGTMDIYDLEGMERLAEKHGGAFTVRYKSREVVIVADADLARHILVDHFLDYQKGKGMMGQFGEVLGRGLFTSDGEAWARDRKLLSPLFQSKLMERFERLFESHTTCFLGQLESTAGAGMEVHPMVSRYSLQLAAECFFSVRSVDAFPFGAIDELKYLVKEFRQDLRSIPRETFGRVQAGCKAFRAFVNELIAERRATGTEHYDVLEHFASDGSLTEEEVFGQVSSLIAAAYDTTNVSLTFIIKLLSLHPERQEALRAEVAALDEPVRMQDVMKLRGVRAFVDETLRLYPPVWAIPRYSVREHTVGGLKLPKDRDYLIYTYLMHRSPRYWSDPEVFRPERFSGAAPEPSTKAAYHPFSLGRRTCIGMGFALYEMLYLVVRLLRRFRVRAVPQPFEVVPLYPVISTSEPIRVHLEVLC